MDAPAASTSVKVAVRLRPFNHSEKENDSKLIIKIHPRESQCTIVNPNKDNDEKSFTYDFLYNSFLPEDDENHASQQTVWNDLGNELLDAAWSGYNYSLFAYGQTGSGKSHSMVGFGDQRGIIPRACEAIFLKIRESENEAAKAQLEAGDSGAGGNNATNSGPDTTYKIEVSMLEIYNEKVRDLFVPLSSQDRGGLKVRDSPKTGAYVEGLKKIPVIGYHQIERLMAFGSRNRTVASTMMNETSSRAHTIFTITFVQTRTNRETMKVSDIRSSISLVDLAGSERAGKTGATGDRLVEGGHINKSLSALGNVINALSTNATKKKKLLVPYRDAVLTHLLKNSLGGNAKTTMIAAISPADTNYGETLSTLRYADRAKNIQNVAIVNEDANEKLIRQLREQMEALRKQLENTNSGGNIEEERERMKKELEEKLRAEYESKQLAWEKSQQLLEKELNMEGGGSSDTGSADQTSPSSPLMVNLNEDAALSGVLKYPISSRTTSQIGTRPIKEARSTGVSTTTTPTTTSIVIGGMGVMSSHARISRGDGDDIMLYSLPGARTLLNGVSLAENVGVRVGHEDRVIFGNNSVFKFVFPGREGIGVEVDWEFAMKEANKETLSKMQEFNHAEVAAGEKAKKDMEAKVLELERRLMEERAKAENRDNEYKGGKEEMVARERELEAKLAMQVKETEKLLKRQERERQERSLIDRQLLHTLPLVHEANCISEEMGKGMRFSVKLVSKTVEGELGETWEPSYKTEVCVIVSYGLGGGEGSTAGAGTGTGTGTPKSKNAANRRPSVYTTGAGAVGVVGATPKSFVDNATAAKGRQNLWSHSKFHNRIYIMREMYHTWKESSFSLAGTEFESEEGDPFYDPMEDQLLGIARLQLEAVKYFLDVEEATPLVDYKGASEGELLVGLTPSVDGEGVKGGNDGGNDDDDGDGSESDDSDIEDLAEIVGKTIHITVSIKSLRGLPTDLLQQFNSLYVQFRFFAADDYVRTPKVHFKSINPKVDYKTRLEFRVTEEFCEYVVGGSLGFECYLSTEKCEKGGEGEEGEGEKSALERGGEEEKNQDKDAIICALRIENSQLKETIKVLEAKLAGGGAGSRSEENELPRAVMNLRDAKEVDRGLNVT